jgi:hypothetical protein
MQTIEQHIGTVAADLDTLAQNRAELQTKQTEAQEKRDFKKMADLAGELQALNAVIAEQQALHARLLGDLATLEQEGEQEKKITELTRLAATANEKRIILEELHDSLGDDILEVLERYQNATSELREVSREFWKAGDKIQRGFSANYDYNGRPSAETEALLDAVGERADLAGVMTTISTPAIYGQRITTALSNTGARVYFGYEALSGNLIRLLSGFASK